MRSFEWSGTRGPNSLGPADAPVAGILLDIFTEWRRLRPEISLRLFEMHDQGIRLALAERRIDAAIIARPSQWPGATGLEIYRERFIAAVPVGHPLTRRAALRWNDLQAEILLTQGWEDSQTARELYTSLIGGGLTFVTHSTGKEAIFVLVAAGCGVTLAMESQAQIVSPGVVFRPILEPNAWLDVHLVWPVDTEDARPA